MPLGARTKRYVHLLAHGGSGTYLKPERYASPVMNQVACLAFSSALAQPEHWS